MTEQEVFEKLQVVIASTFNIDKSEITINTGHKTIEKWDSIGHIKLILTVESEFNINFKTDSIPNLLSVKLLQEEIMNEK